VSVNGSEGTIMDVAALLISVEVARRDAQSALPGAAVQPPADRWRRLRAAVRRLGRGPDPTG